MIFTAGPLAEFEYGASVHGLTDGEVLQLHRAAAMALSPRARGRSLTKVMLLARMPTWRAEVAVITHYAKQVWLAVTRRPEELNGAMSITEIARVWREAQVSDLVDSASGKRKWAHTKGPISSMILSLDRVGWSMPDPFTLRDRKGNDIVLTRTSPALLAILLHEAVIITAEVKEGAKAAEHDPAFRGRRVAVEHVAAQLKSDRRLTCADRAAYKSVVCGALMTFNRAASLGYLVADKCPLCGAQGDTVRHRIWRCRHPKAVEARDSVAPQWLQKEEQRRPADDSMWVTGWFPHPADVWPEPSSGTDALVIYGEGEDSEGPTNEDDRRGLKGLLYGDGSCSTHTFRELRRAGAAVVQRAGASTVKRVRYPVPAPLPQTPQAAEYVVAALVQQLADRGRKIDLAVDCLNVVRDLTAPFSVATASRKVHAGINRTTLADDNWPKYVNIRKVKAHVNPDTVEEGRAREDAVGNQWADKEAKAAAEMHPRPPPAMITELEAAMRRAKLIVRTIAKVTQVFPSLPRERMDNLPGEWKGLRSRRVTGTPGRSVAAYGDAPDASS